MSVLLRYRGRDICGDDATFFRELIASHLLGRMARRVSSDWEALWGHPILYLESFITPALHAGTCYKAANWRFLGPTTGRGKDNQTRNANRPKKQVLGLALTPRFREILGVTE